MFENKLFEEKLKEINTKMASFEEHIRKVANHAYSKNNFTELIESLLKYKSLGSSYS